MKPAPPVIKYLAMVASDGVILETQLLQIRRIINIAAIKNNRIFEQLFDAPEIGPAKFIPLGEDQQGRGAGEHVVIARSIANPLAEDLLRLLHGFRIKGLNLR